jgi:DNA-directed RNA polymerase subunit E'/Rpb7
MFVLYTLRDLIMLAPSVLHQDFREAVTEALEAKYVGQQLKNEGYGVAIYELRTHDCHIVNGYV